MFVYDTLFWNLKLDYISSTFMLVFLLVLLLVRGIQLLKEAKSLPPGPWGLPILGSLPFMKGDLHLHYRDLTKKYGSLISTRIGSELIVVLSDYKMIRDLFRKEELTGRPNNQFYNILGGYGVINVAGKLWRDQRRFLHGGLRHFGMSYVGSRQRQMEKRIMDEVEDFLNALRERESEPVDMNPVFAVSISNVICDVLMSVRFSHSDRRFIRFMDLIDEGFKLFGSMETAHFIPMLRFLPRYARSLEKFTKNREEMANFLQETIDEHKKSFDPSNLRDLLDTYLYEIQKANEEGTGHNLFEGKDHDRQMQQIMGDLFSAGMETIKSTLLWSVLFMLHHPEQMMAVREELDQVVGRQRLPNLEDLAYLPVTESTIMEVLRISSIVPMGTTHSPIRDVKLNGFHLPQHSQVIPLLHAVHMDPNLWDEPNKFNPFRFINSEGKVTKPDYFLPFGVGRRMCLGEILARMELFLFFASLMHSFDLSVPEGETLPTMKGIAGVTISPTNFRVVLKSRPKDTVESDLRPAKHR